MFLSSMRIPWESKPCINLLPLSYHGQRLLCLCRRTLHGLDRNILHLGVGLLGLGREASDLLGLFLYLGLHREDTGLINVPLPFRLLGGQGQPGFRFDPYPINRLLYLAGNAGFQLFREGRHLCTQAGKLLFLAGNGLLALGKLPVGNFASLGNLPLQPRLFLHEACLFLLEGIPRRLPLALEVIFEFLLVTAPLLLFARLKFF